MLQVSMLSLSFSIKKLMISNSLSGLAKVLLSKILLIGMIRFLFKIRKTLRKALLRTRKKELT
jgi:hypothetical protein